MYIIGLTGGIGSGKSAAAAAFRDHGVAVINADQVARDVVAPGSGALNAIAEHFGEQILQPDGQLDRAALRQRVFSDNTARQWLEQLTHPLIGETIDQRLAATRCATEANYRILESPLLMETDQRHRVQRLLLVDTEESLQLQRSMARDKNSEQQVRAIMASQMSRQDKIALADDILPNSGTLAQLQTCVQALHRQYSAIATTSKA